MGNQTLLEKQKTTVLKELQELIDEKIPVGFTSLVLTEVDVAEYTSIYKDVVPVLDRMFNGDLTVQEIAVERKITSGSVHRIRHEEERRLSWRIFKSTKKVDLKKWKDYVFPLPKDFCLDDLGDYIYNFIPRKVLDKIEKLNTDLSDLLLNLRSISLLEKNSALIKNPEINLCKLPASAIRKFYNYASCKFFPNRLGMDDTLLQLLTVLDRIETAEYNWGCSDEKWREVCSYAKNNPDTWKLNDIPESIVVHCLEKYNIDGKRTLSQVAYFSNFNNTYHIKIGEMPVSKLKEFLDADIESTQKEDPAPWSNMYIMLSIYKDMRSAIDELEKDIMEVI